MCDSSPRPITGAFYSLTLAGRPLPWPVGRYPGPDVRPSTPVILLVSLATAGLFGTGDFCGGLAAKRVGSTRVVAFSHVVGLLGALLVALAVGSEPSAEALLVGALAGVFGGIGVGLLYRRLALGPMHVVAPLTAMTSALVPATWGALRGESLGPQLWLGVVIGLIAIILASTSAKTPAVPNDIGGAPVDAKAVIESLLAGSGFGLFFILLSTTAVEAGPWPIVGARMTTSILLVGGLLLLDGRSLSAGGQYALGLIVATGVLDVAANIGFLWAANRGQLVIVAVVTSLYPLATVGLARVFMAERMSRLQGIGLASALGSTVLIASG